jgi:antitoxin (DNA-binding transcriptional repressor) of toxin-antitoxin stability system
MSEHSVAEATERLSSLIDRALKGEDVVITRDGRAVVTLRPLEVPTQAPRARTAEMLAWLRANRGERIAPPDEDAGTFVSRMRDEEQRS